ncbi:nucleotidyltransferase substrate binding protein [Lederbergia sp. NSJ-179]|uniref:nucleotidyltransferase substrate binding protein n=1 Tax=Lederbergia sp. NSJ-179 TaxID=2931402 RepID=UPI001FD0DD76|nr:nucleotidyltransferase substrate binding protein [Lederbergia sp. NSJ-179]MCJ7840028.1 nucleotidyltransferase substrate binding protein [Lederbergia sp. NSJ-179]
MSSKERLYEKLEDYKQACMRLKEATELEIEYDIVIDGVIQRFEFTFELSWKLMKMLLEYYGVTELRSPRATIREAFANRLISDGEQWIDMMVDRNKTSHLYDEVEAKLIYDKIRDVYTNRLMELCEKAEKEIAKIQ